MRGKPAQYHVITIRIKNLYLFAVLMQCPRKFLFAIADKIQPCQNLLLVANPFFWDIIAFKKPLYICYNAWIRYRDSGRGADALSLL